VAEGAAAVVAEAVVHAPVSVEEGVAHAPAWVVVALAPVEGEGCRVQVILAVGEDRVRQRHHGQVFRDRQPEASEGVMPVHGQVALAEEMPDHVRVESVVATPVRVQVVLVEATPVRDRVESVEATPVRGREASVGATPELVIAPT